MGLTPLQVILLGAFLLGVVIAAHVLDNRFPMDALFLGLRGRLMLVFEMRPRLRKQAPASPLPPSSRKRDNGEGSGSAT